MSNYEIVPGRGRVKKDNSVFGCGILWSSSEPQRRETPYERTKRQVYETGNKWAIENFHATHD